MPFRPEFVVLTEFGPDRPHDWILTQTLEYTPPDGRHPTIVEEGFDTDLASVPHLLTWYAPRYGVYTKAAIVHDHLCRDTKGDRFQADLVFRKAMEELGVPLIRRWIMWTAVTWATIIGNLTRALALTILGVVVVVVAALLTAGFARPGTDVVVGVTVGMSLVFVTAICYLASPHRPLLPLVLACYLITVPGILLLVVSLPLLAFRVLAGLLDLLTNPAATWRGWSLWITPLAASVAALLASALRRVVPPLPGPSREKLARDYRDGNSRQQRLANLLLAK